MLKSDRSRLAAASGSGRASGQTSEISSSRAPRAPAEHLGAPHARRKVIARRLDEHARAFASEATRDHARRDRSRARQEAREPRHAGQNAGSDTRLGGYERERRPTSRDGALEVDGSHALCQQVGRVFAEQFVGDVRCDRCLVERTHAVARTRAPNPLQRAAGGRAEGRGRRRAEPARERLRPSGRSDRHHFLYALKQRGAPDHRRLTRTSNARSQRGGHSLFCGPEL